MVSIRINLASNIRRLCSEKEYSYANVSRELGISRQQLNRYLTAQNLPNQTIIDKLCKFFKIDESKLFVDVSKHHSDDNSDDEPYFHKQICERMGFSEKTLNSSFESGHYFCFFDVPNHPELVQVSLLIIWEEFGKSFFRRFTGFGEQKNSPWSLYKGDHRGFIIERVGSVFLVGMNSIGTLEPSLTSLQWEMVSEPVLTGSALINTPSGPSTVNVVMHPSPYGNKLLTNLRLTRVSKRSEASLSTLVSSLLTHSCGADRKSYPGHLVQDISLAS